MFVDFPARRLFVSLAPLSHRPSWRIACKNCTADRQTYHGQQARFVGLCFVRGYRD